MNKELDNIPSVDRLSRIHGLMAVSKLSYNEAERLVRLSDETSRSAIDLWAEELLQKASKPHEAMV